MLDIHNLSCGILRHIRLHIPRGECLALVGRSGSGKSTLLNAIAGYLDYQGSIRIEGESIDKLPPWQRPCRYLNQNLYLFPHQTVDQNLALAQGKQGQDPVARQRILKQLCIDHLTDRLPATLSGGERQRAALARSLMGAPKLLLLDEPFSALDWETRRLLWQYLKDRADELGLTVLLVTHDPQEAAFLADRQIRLHQGALIS